MAGGAGANVLGTAGTPPAGGGGQDFASYWSQNGGLPGRPAIDSTNTTTQQDVMGTQLRNLNSTGTGLNQLFNNMQTQQQQPIAPPPPAPINNVTDIYKNVLGRDPDAAGLAYWQGQADKGMSLADIQNSFKATDEYKNKPTQQTQQTQQQMQQQQQVQQPQAPQQQGQQGGKAGGYGQPQTQNPYQSPAQVFMPQVDQSGGGQSQPAQQMPQQMPQQTASPYQVQNPYQGMLQSSYSQMINPYMQQQQQTPYQQQFRQQYNPLSYRPNMEQVKTNLSNVKPSVYTNELADAKAKLKEYEDAEAARNAASEQSTSSGGG